MIRIENIYINKKKDIILPSEMNIEDNQITLIKGPSGSGKTLLLYLVGLLEPLNNTQYYFDNILINQLNQKQLYEIKKNYISFVFQDNSLIEYATIYENYLIVSKMHNIPYSEEKCKDLLKKFNLSVKIEQTIHQISRGQRQRLSIALALLKKPKLLILDEPTSFLDYENKMLVIQMLEDIKKEESIKILIAGHDKELDKIADNKYKIADKRIICEKRYITHNSNPIQLRNKQKVKSFYQFYNYIYAKYHYKEFIKIYLFLMIIMSAFLIENTVSALYIQRLVDYFNQQTDNEVMIYNENGINNTIYENIHQLSYVEDVYYNRPFAVYDGKNYLVADVVYPNQSIMTNREGIYISNNYNADSQYLLIETDRNLDVVGIIPNEYKDPIRNQLSEVWIPYSYVQNLLTSGDTVVVFVSSIEDVFNLQDYIQKNYSDLIVSPLTQGIAMAKQNLNILKQLSIIFSIVIGLLGTFSIFSVYYKIYNNRLKEFQLLMTMGISKKGIYIITLLQALYPFLFSVMTTSLILYLLRVSISPTNYILSIVYILGIIGCSLITVRNGINKGISNIIRN